MFALCVNSGSSEGLCVVGWESWDARWEVLWLLWVIMDTSYLLEKIILNRISDNLMTNPNQFGFKPKHNTEMCIFALKEAILKYCALNSSVYSCFLDASKAFDRVNHSKLFDTLVKRGVPLYIIRIIRFWYTSQTMCVCWNIVMSSGFKVSNGVRQGGILSPYLFCVYADKLSRMLNNVTAGCFVGASLVNHLCMQMIWFYWPHLLQGLCCYLHAHAMA